MEGYQLLNKFEQKHCLLASNSTKIMFWFRASSKTNRKVNIEYYQGERERMTKVSVRNVNIQ